MANDTNGDEITTSKSITESGFFDAGTQAIDKLSEVAERRGLKTMSLATGIFILVAIIGEFLTAGDYVPNHGEILGLIIGSVLIIVPVLLNELDYKWALNANVRKQELVTERLRIEADYQVARLEITKLSPVSDEGESKNGPTPPK